MVSKSIHLAYMLNGELAELEVEEEGLDTAGIHWKKALADPSGAKIRVEQSRSTGLRGCVKIFIKLGKAIVLMRGNDGGHGSWGGSSRKFVGLHLLQENCLEKVLGEGVFLVRTIVDVDSR